MYVFLALAIVLGLNRFDSLSEERVRDRFAVAAQIDYAQCLSRIDNRTVVRNVFNGIFNQLPESESISQLKKYLDNAYPQLSTTECDIILIRAGIEVQPTPVSDD